MTKHLLKKIYFSHRPAFKFCQDEVFTQHLKKQDVSASVIKEAFSATTYILFNPKCGILGRWVIFLIFFGNRNCQLEIGKRQRLWMNDLCCDLLDARIFVNKVPLMAGDVVNRATIYREAAICHADSNEVNAADFSFNLCLHALNFGQVCLWYDSWLSLELQLEQIESAIDEVDPVNFVLPLVQSLIVVVVRLNVVWVKWIELKGENLARISRRDGFLIISQPFLFLIVLVIHLYREF